MRPRWPLVVSALIITGFVVGSLCSRAQHSLLIAEKVGWAWGLLLIFFPVVCLVAGGFALFVKSCRRPMLDLCGSLLIAVLSSAVAMANLCYPDERALEDAMVQLQPLVDALQRFEREHGKAPETLGELVPLYLTALPKCQWLDVQIDPQYEHDGPWRIYARSWLQGGFDPPMGEIEYRSDQRYEGVPPEAWTRHGRSGLVRGWRWLTWS